MHSTAARYFDVDNYVVTAQAVEGPWSAPAYLNSVGFDPSLFHDDDGRHWLVTLEWDPRQGYEHPGAIVLDELDPHGPRLVGETAPDLPRRVRPRMPRGSPPLPARRPVLPDGRRGRDRLRARRHAGQVRHDRGTVRAGSAQPVPDQQPSPHRGTQRPRPPEAGVVQPRRRAAEGRSWLLGEHAGGGVVRRPPVRPSDRPGPPVPARPRDRVATGALVRRRLAPPDPWGNRGHPGDAQPDRRDAGRAGRQHPPYRLLGTRARRLVLHAPPARKARLAGVWDRRTRPAPARRGGGHLTPRELRRGHAAAGLDRHRRDPAERGTAPLLPVGRAAGHVRRAAAPLRRASTPARASAPGWRPCSWWRTA